MTEEKLKKYFENSLTADQLALDIKKSRQQTSFDVIRFYIDTIKSDDQFEITKNHLIKLCNDTIDGNLSPTDLNTISFAIITSDFFYWDSDSVDSETIETVIYDWDNQDIGYDITINNISLWKEYLQTGNYKLDKEELRNKFRNDRRTQKKNSL